MVGLRTKAHTKLTPYQFMHDDYRVKEIAEDLLQDV